MNWLLVYHLFVTAFLLLVTLNVALNWRLFVAPQPRSFGPSDPAPLVSVLVPARNEALRITPCLQSLAAQDYPRYETLVLDDHSGDATAEVVTNLGFSREKNRRAPVTGGSSVAGGLDGKIVGLPPVGRRRER